MVITDRLVLPADAVLQPASELTASLRTLIAAESDDYVLSRSSSRSLAKVMDGDAARFIRHFERPSTIAQAVARYSRGEPASADQLLESAFPLLQSLIAEGLLVEAGSMESKTVQPSLVTGDEVGGWSVLRCVQALEDSEVYQVQGVGQQMAALKIGRLGNRKVADALAWEAEVLKSATLAVTPTVTPTVVGQGEWNGRPWLALDWIAGADAAQTCNELRDAQQPDLRGSLLAVGASILNAYAALHERGIVHGDVHPRNILITPPCTATIVDFGLAALYQDQNPVDRGVRGGIGGFFEPEFAAALLEGSPHPIATFAGDQHALAAVLYLLLTGHQYLDFAVEKKQMLREIANTPMLPFASHGIDPWPAVERLLARALEKVPAARFPSVRAFAEAWQNLADPGDLPEPALATTQRKTIRSGILSQIATAESLRTWESLPPPTTCLHYGSAGIAYALYRMSCATGDPELLAWADVWITRAGKMQASADAFYCDDLDITRETVGASSLYHGPAGVHMVEALIAQARGDVSLQRAATEAFIERSRDSSGEMDLVLGRAGLLLGCTFLLDALSSQQASECDRALRIFGNDIVDQIWSALDGRPAIEDMTEISNLGMSHGWAGLLYATLCWSAASGQSPPHSLQERLAQLAACAQPAGRGLRWRWDHNGAGIYVPSWCNGSAGHVHLWTAAYAHFGEASHLRLAEGAAWTTWENPGSGPSLCCGSTGQAYALMNLHRHTGEPAWLSRSRHRAGEAIAGAVKHSGMNRGDSRPLSLYKGSLGVALLELDLEFPQQARMPAFERE